MRGKEIPMGNWQLDPYHTQVEFSAKHLGMMTVRGYFDEVSTTADIDPEHPETAKVEATISTASIRTNNGIRDNDIRSSNFLEVDKFPVITFKSTSIKPAGEDHYTLTGDLTIKGNTHPVTLDVVKYAPGRLQRYYQDQQEGLRPELQRDPGRQARRQRGDPDPDRGRDRRAEGGRGDRGRLTPPARRTSPGGPVQRCHDEAAGAPRS
jgi:polyisoprenoid-binding protein YceI